MNRLSLGPVVIPALAIIYAAYMMYEQISDPEYRPSTIYYAAGVGIFIIISSIYIVICEINKPSGYSQDEIDLVKENEDTDRAAIISYPRRIAILSIVGTIVYFFEYLGYAISFSAITLGILVLLKVRSTRLLLGIPIGSVFIVHYVFVTWFDLPLPSGLL